MAPPRSDRPYVFEVYPNDWVGKTILVFFDGAVGLDSGLTTQERLARGDTAIGQMRITPGTTRSEIARFLDDHAPLKARFAERGPEESDA